MNSGTRCIAVNIAGGVGTYRQVDSVNVPVTTAVTHMVSNSIVSGLRYFDVPVRPRTIKGDKGEFKFEAQLFQVTVCSGFIISN
jgi:hypothetical protein